MAYEEELEELEELEYEEDYLDDEEGNDYYQGYDEDDYQNPDSDYEE
ncbi:hypothetical protein [Helicobacter enhydrae]|nr:hypothetical protein [Helicobacter enhydrae]